MKQVDDILGAVGFFIAAAIIIAGMIPWNG